MQAQIFFADSLPPQHLKEILRQYALPTAAQRLKKEKLKAYQAPARGGKLWVNALPGKVEIGGQCVIIIAGLLNY